MGGGAMGSVYRGVHLTLGVARAIKLLRADYADHPAVRERFQREARVAAGLRHPNIVQTFDIDQDRGVQFIVMDLVPGQPLSAVLRAEGPVGARRALDILWQLGSALDFAHAHGVAHRDVKPGNVIIGPDDQVTLVDFGIARAAESSTLTGQGTTLGTPTYMAPETFTGTAPADDRRGADLYSFGVVAYELFVGQVPFPGRDTAALIRAHTTMPPPSPRLLRPELSAGVERSLLRQLSKGPAQRFATAADLVKALARGVAPSEVPERVRMALGDGDTVESDVWRQPVSAMPTMGAEAPTTVMSRQVLPAPVARPRPSRARSGTAGWLIGGAVAAGLLLFAGGAVAMGRWLIAADQPTAVADPPPAPFATATAIPSAGPPTVPATQPVAAPPPTLAPTAVPPPTTGPTAAPTLRPAVAPTVAPTRAPAASPQSVAPRIILDERFEDNRRGWPQNQRDTARVGQGVYYLTARDPGRFVSIAAPLAESFRDVTVFASFRKIGGPPGGGYGIILRDQGPPPRNGVNQTGRYYVLEVGEGQQWGIWRRETDHFVDLVKFTPSDKIRPPGETNIIEARASGNRLSIRANGADLGSIEDGALAEGRVGIYVAGDGNEVVVDRFAVRVP